MLEAGVSEDFLEPEVERQEESPEERETYGLFIETKLAIFRKYEEANRTYVELQKAQVLDGFRHPGESVLPSISLIANLAGLVMGIYVDLSPKLDKVRGRETRHKYLVLKELDSFVYGNRSFANAKEFSFLIRCFKLERDFLEDLGITRFDLPSVDRGDIAGRELL